jgi:hypothetical protein
MGDHAQRLEEILAEWDLDEVPETITLTNITSPYTFTGTPTSFPNAIWTTTGTGTAAPWITASPNSSSARINLTGDEADIEVNGWSLVTAIKSIEQRLDLFQPNPKLEAEWEQLRELGEQYRKLEQHIRDKQATWERLKAMPAPDVD